MGQEILYCSRCRVRVVGGDFDKGEAYRVGDKVACNKCAMEILATAPQPLQQQILEQKKKALEKKTGSPPPVSRGLTGSSTAVRSARVAEAPRIPLAAVAGIVPVLVIVVGLMVMSGGSTPLPPPPVKPAPAPIALPTPAPKDTDAEAKRELEAAERKRKEQTAAEQTALLSRAREMGINGEYQKAADLLSGARKNHSELEWTKPIDERIQEFENTMASEFPALREKAVEARKREGAAELGLIRDKIAHWGSARYNDELDKSLAEVFPPVTPRGGVIKLALAEATLQGNNKFRRTAGEWKIIQNWIDSQDYLLWNVSPRQAGTYTIRINYAVPKEMAGKPFGGEFEIAVVGGEAKTFTVEPTSSWGDFKTITYGSITLPATTCTISIRPVKIVNNLMSLHYIELVQPK